VKVIKNIVITQNTINAMMYVALYKLMSIFYASLKKILMTDYGAYSFHFVYHNMSQF
jgi:hypothetical protein